MKKNTPLFWNVFFAGERPLFKRYFFSFLLSIISLYLISLFWEFEAELPVTSFAILAVIFAAVYGGKGPAFLTTLITSIGIDYFYSEPFGEFSGSTSSLVRVIIYLAVTLLISGIVNSLRKTLILLGEQNKKLEFEKMARENVLSIVSHDLKSPLSSILMNTEFLLKASDSGTAGLNTKKLLGNIYNSGTRMNRLIEDLLDSVKIEAGNFKIQLKECNIVDVLKSSIEESRNAAISKNIELKLISSCETEKFKCDCERIIQVMNNLLSNAVKFSPENSEVNITFETTEKTLVITVKDFGVGIPQDEQLNLFERHWQSKKTAHEGTGLGLYISRNIIEAHHGKISVSSRLGEGSEFQIILPRNL